MRDMALSDGKTIHHRELHDLGNEEIWWEGVKIDPISVAQKLWQQSHYGKKNGLNF